MSITRLSSFQQAGARRWGGGMGGRRAEAVGWGGGGGLGVRTWTTLGKSLVLSGSQRITEHRSTPWTERGEQTAPECTLRDQRYPRLSQAPSPLSLTRTLRHRPCYRWETEAWVVSLRVVWPGGQGRLSGRVRTALEVGGE